MTAKKISNATNLPLLWLSIFLCDYTLVPAALIYAVRMESNVLHSFLVNNAFLICKEKNCSVELSAILLKHRFNFIYSRLFRRASCNGCGMFVIPTEFVMRAKGYVYHQQCFNCIECGQQLRQGDHCAIKDGQLFCGIDFEKEMNMMALSPRSTNLRNTFQIH